MPGCSPAPGPRESVRCSNLPVLLVLQMSCQQMTARPLEYLFPSRAFMLCHHLPNAGLGTRVSPMHKVLDLAKSHCYSSTAAGKLDLSREMLQTCCDGHIKPISLLACTMWEGSSGHLCKTNHTLHKAVSGGCINWTCSAEHPSVTSGKYGFPG